MEHPGAHVHSGGRQKIAQIPRPTDMRAPHEGPSVRIVRDTRRADNDRSVQIGRTGRGPSAIRRHAEALYSMLGPAHGMNAGLIPVVANKHPAVARNSKRLSGPVPGEKPERLHL